MRNAKNIFWAILMIGLRSYGQDIHFSQFWDVIQFQNPALIGNFDGNVRASALYRNQWNQFGTPLQTIYGGVEVKKNYENHDYLAVGFYGLQDKFDLLFYRQYRGFLSLAFSKYLSQKFTISAGIQGGLKMTSINYDRLTFDRQWNPQTGHFEPTNQSFENFDNVNTIRPVLNTGISFNLMTGKVLNSLDMSISYVNSPKDVYTNSKTNIPMKYNINAHSYIALKEKLTLMPKASVQYSQAANSFFTGTLIKKNMNINTDIFGGAYYRWGVGRNSDAICPAIGVRLNNIKFGTSVDITTSGINQENQKFSFEVSLIYMFRPATSSFYSIDCMRL